MNRRFDAGPPAAGAAADDAPGLADRMRTATRALHANAERTGVVAALLRGTADRPAYTRYLAALLPVYSALESALDTHADDPVLGPLADPAIRRAPAIRADLACLGATALEPVAAARRYAAHLDTLGAERPALLVAHLYTRYLGDLNGGRLLGERVRTALALPEAALAFHTFPAIPDVRAFVHDYRARFDAAPIAAADREAIVAEATAAFTLNIALSVEAAG